MRTLHIYRSVSGGRLVFRGSEIDKVLYDRGFLVVTKAGCPFRTISGTPETVMEDVERNGDSVHHYFHWTPTETYLS